MRWFHGLLVVGLVIAACATPSQDQGGQSELLVSAASSLTDVLAELERGFEADSPDVDVVVNLAGSSALREQILEGAPVDVFMSADAANMDEIVERGMLDGRARIVARNSLQIAVPSGNPASISDLEDFANPVPLLGLCAEGVPCGDLAREALKRAGVVPSIDTNEPDVRALLTKIEVGELDAGIVYTTDVIAARSQVDGVGIPDGVNVMTDYLIGIVSDAPNPTAAAEFVEYVLSPAGKETIVGYGFTIP